MLGAKATLFLQALSMSSYQAVKLMEYGKTVGDGGNLGVLDESPTSRKHLVPPDLRLIVAGSRRELPAVLENVIDPTRGR
jgi:hypothetical protein